MNGVLEQIKSISSRIETTEAKVKSLSAENQRKIEENNQKINDLSKQIDDIFAELKTCQDESSQVNNNYQQTLLNLEEVRLESSEYDLIDGNVLNKLIQSAEEKKNQLLSEIELTLTSLNENLNNIRVKIQELDIENGSLSDLSSLIELKYTQLVEAFNETLKSFNIQLEPLEEALEGNSNYQKDDHVKQQKPVSSQTIDLEEFFTTKEKASSSDDNIEPIKVVPEDQNPVIIENVQDADKTSEEPTDKVIEEPTDNVVVEETTADLSSLIQDKPFFKGVINNPVSVEKDDSTTNLEDNLISLEDMIQSIPYVPSAQENEETTAVVEEMTNDALSTNQIESEQNLPKEELAPKDIVVENKIVVSQSEPETVQPEVSTPVNNGVVSIEAVNQEPTLQEQLKDNDNPLKLKYIGLDRLSLSNEQEDYVIKNITPEKFSQLINIFHNYGIAIDSETLAPFYKYIANVEDPKMIDEVFTLLRGVGKNNNELDFSTMLDHILLTHPENVQNNIIQLYSDGKDPLTVQIQLMCSEYFDNISKLKDEGFDTDALTKAFPETICSMPLIQFKSRLKNNGSLKNDSQEQKTLGGKAA